AGSRNRAGASVMLSIGEQFSAMGRRECFRVGSLGLRGLSLPSMLAARAAGSPIRRAVTDKSVIFLFMAGGPSQFETFDPKMDAPVEVRSTTGEIPTALPGITFGSTYEKLARLADRLTVVRAYTTGDANHDI